MKQRVLALLCALLMLPALAACGEAKPAESEAPPTEQATPEPTPDDSELIVIEPEQTPLPVVTPAPTPIPVMAPIEPEEIPEGLDAFLNRFNYGYTDRMGGKEYDSENCVDVRANILAQLVTSASCVDFSLYPGRAPVFHWNDGTIDPQNMAGEGGSYGEFDPAQIEWIAENILHISEKDYRAVLSRCTVSGTFYVDQNDAGQERFYLSVPTVSEPNTLVRPISVESDGVRYELVYDYLMQPNYYLGSFFAVAELREIEGETYWTLCSQTARLPEEESRPAPELFALLGDTFYLNDADGLNHTELHIAEDGSFYGSYQGRELDLLGEDFDEIAYYSEFEGRFTNPKRINAYTYTIELQEIRYLDETEEFIITDELGRRILNVSSTAFGLDGAWVFTIYRPGAPYYRLPGSFTAWYLNSVAVDNYPLELPTWGLWNSTDGSAFGTVAVTSE